MSSEPRRGSRVLPLTVVSDAASPPPVSVAAADGAPAPAAGRAGRVIIDVAGVCQAKCPYCAQNSGKERRKSIAGAPYMPPDLFRAIIVHLRSSVNFVKKVDRVYLYNWGEPFLAPAINDYLEILRDNDLYAVISSNFQKVPEIKTKNFPAIKEVLFSLSGLTEDTYGRIHGGPHISVSKVFANFEAFNVQMKRHAPQSQIFMAWHRYQFNEHQFWKAYEYSRQQQIGFIPSVAFLNDLAELIQAASDKFPAARLADAQRDLFYTHMTRSFGRYRDNGALYDCPAWDDVVVDEQGRLLICCGTDAKTAIGTALDTSYDEMRRRKIAHPLCKVCKGTGVAEWAHNNHHAVNQLPWPKGGGLRAVRLKLANDKWKVKNDIRHLLNKMPFGEAVLDVYRTFKHS